MSTEVDQVAAAESRARIAEARARERAANLRAGVIGEQERSLARLRETGRSSRGANNPASYAGSYRAAGRSRTRHDAGRAMGGSADAHLDPATHDRLRRDSQELLRNEPAARAIVRCAANMIVGTGPVLQPMTQNKGFNEKVAELWWNWCNNSDIDGSGMCDLRGQDSFAEILNIVCRAKFDDGDQLVIKTDANGGSLQLVESERLVSPMGRGARNTFTPGEGGMMSGVELDAETRPIRYHIARYDSSGMMRYTGGTISIDAEHAILAVNTHMRRANQVRGEPALAAAIEWFDKLSMLDEAVLEAFRVAACFSAIVTSPNPGLEQQAWAGETVARPGDPVTGGDHEIEMEPGMVKFTGLQGELKQMTPQHPSTQYESFVMMHLAAIGADIGVPVLLAYMDASKSNFSGFRAALALAFRGFNSHRAATASREVSPIFRWKVAGWIRSGALPFVEDWHRHDWNWPPAPVLDPKLEVEAQALAVEKLLKTRKQAVAELHGGDIEDLYKQRKIEKDTEDEMGLAPNVGGGGPWGLPKQEPGKAASDEDEGRAGDQEADEPAGAARDRAERNGFAHANGWLNGRHS